MIALNEDYKSLVDRFGPPSMGRPVPSADIAALKGHLPQGYLDLLFEFDVGLWKDGYFQLCNPREWTELVREIFDGDADFRSDRMFLIGFSAFGNMLLWSEDYQEVSVNMSHHVVSSLRYFKPADTVSADKSMVLRLLRSDSTSYDAFDENGNGLFKHALKAYGPLPYGHIYAPKLHPALGGARTLENYRPAPALEALAIAAQATRFVLRDTLSLPPRDVRLIGRQG